MTESWLASPVGHWHYDARTQTLRIQDVTGACMRVIPLTPSPVPDHEPMPRGTEGDCLVGLDESEAGL